MGRGKSIRRKRVCGKRGGGGGGSCEDEGEGTQERREGVKLRGSNSDQIKP